MNPKGNPTVGLQEREKRMMEAGPVWARKLQSLAYGVIRVVGATIFLYLTYYSLGYSQYMFPVAPEIPIDMKDAPTGNILAVGILCVVVFCFLWFEKKLTERQKIWIERILLVISLLWMACCSYWWISVFDRRPEGDQAFIYGGASYFLEGGYTFLGKGGYCEIYPHQLGLIALMELLFLVVGTYNYYAFEIVCAIMAVGIVFLGYCLLQEFAVPFGAKVLYCVMMMGCIPLICYTSWVYGDVPSIFFALLTAWFAGRWGNCQKVRYLVGIVAGIVMAMLVRKNSMILLVALCLLSIVYVIRYRKWQIGLTALLAVLCAVLAYQGIYKMYEIRSGYEHKAGLPVNSWIAMGLMEREGQCGWYNNLGKEVLYSVDLDYGATEEIMSEYIGQRLDVFQADKTYARWFFKKKILSQWNEPLYQSIYFSAKTLENEQVRMGGFLEELYYTTEVHDRVFHFADIMQFLVYAGMLLYYLFAVRKDSGPLEHLLAVTIIGGFFFSVIWEAKARYIFPYYVMMYPLAVTGYFRAGQFIGALGEKVLKKK